MSNAISDANSIYQVVEIINKSNQGEASVYFGGTDTREAEIMAGQYAYDAAEDSGYLDKENLKFQLDCLVENGAFFDYDEALNNAISRMEDN